MQDWEEQGFVEKIGGQYYYDIDYCVGESIKDVIRMPWGNKHYIATRVEDAIEVVEHGNHKFIRCRYEVKEDGDITLFED